MGWPSDSESRGAGFDSRLAQVTFGLLFGHVGVTFSKILEDVGKCLGVLWGCFRLGLGGFREKVPRRSENSDFQKCLGVFFPDRGALD